MISFHCLEIPLKNMTDTFSGGEKLRLGLVRATLGYDIIIVDGSLNSLDVHVRRYVVHEMKKIAEQQGKIFIVKNDTPLCDEVITIKDGIIQLEKTECVVD
jgi:ABC-type multidrug transport system ATPase subunit